MIGSALGVWVALRSFDPTRAGERTFPFAPDPACALPTTIISRLFLSGGRVSSGARLLEGHARRGREMALVALPGSGLCS